MRPELTLIPSISILPDRINLFNEVCWYPCKPSRYNQETGEKVRSIKYGHLLNSARSAEGMVSDQARRKMSKAIDWLLLIANPNKATASLSGKQFSFKLAFITLTLPSKQVHDDNIIKKECLNQLLIELKKRYKVRHYIWRAEKQVNGNIHFHILIDKFVPWSELRDRWNRITEKLGYVSRYRDEQMSYHAKGFRVRKHLLPTWSEEKQRAAYNRGAKTQWNNPNSTDIHSIKKVSNMKKYISKYMAKNEKEHDGMTDEEREKMKVEGRIWGCSYELSRLKAPTLHLDEETKAELKQLIETTKCRSYQGDYFSVYYIGIDKLPHTSKSRIFSAIADYLFSELGIPLDQEFF